MHQYFPHEPHLKFQRNVLCHSFFTSPTHFGMCCQEVFSLQCLFHQFEKRGDGSTPSDSQTYSMMAGGEMQRDGKNKTKQNKQ